MIAIFPEIAQAAGARNVEELSVLCRKYFGAEQKYSPRLNVEQLLQQAGLEHQTMSIDTQAVILAKDDKGAFRIVCVLNEGLTAEARQFTLAHQLGHFLLEVQPQIAKGEWSVSGFRETGCPLRRYGFGDQDANLSGEERRMEEIADDFAAALLLPRAMLIRAAEKLGNLKDLATFFGVTDACLRRRLQQVGLEPDEPENFIAAASKLGVPVSGDRPSGTPNSTLGRGLDQDIDPRAVMEIDKANQAAPGPRTIGAQVEAGNQKVVDAKEFEAALYAQRDAAGTTVGADVPKKAPAAGAESTGPIIKGPPRDKEGEAAGSGSNDKNTAEKPRTVLKGMERIREIARMIDKGP